MKRCRSCGQICEEWWATCPADGCSEFEVIPNTSGSVPSNEYSFHSTTNTEKSGTGVQQSGFPWNSYSSDSQNCSNPPAKKPSAGVLIILGVVIVAIIALVMYFLPRGDGNQVGNDTTDSKTLNSYLESNNDSRSIVAETNWSNSDSNENVFFPEEDDEWYEDTNVVSLADLDYWDSSATFGIGPNHETITDNMGNSYDVYFTSGGDWNEYRIDCQYETFEGRFIIRNESRSVKETSVLRIYGDGILLYGATMTGGTRPVDFKLDISDVSILKIQVDSSSIGWGYNTALVDAYLCRSGFSISDTPITPNIYPEGAMSLATLPYWDRSSSGIGPFTYCCPVDTLGNEYYEFFGDSGYQEYLIDGAYSTFTGRLIVEPGSGYNRMGTNGWVKVYGDENLIYEAEIFEGDEPIDFTLDIRGVGCLKIEMRSPFGTAGYQFVDLVNVYLR